MSDEGALRARICKMAELLYMRGYAHGSTGNISVKTGEGIIITPTNSCMGLLEPHRLSLVDKDGNHVSGDKPSKEAFLHLAMYGERPESQAIVHLHSTHSVALSILEDTDPDDAMPPLTAYARMKLGRLAVVPYFRPGDRALAEAVRLRAREHHAVLLANHGPVVAGKSLDDAVFSAEELEETAKLELLTRDRPRRMLTPCQLADLDAAFPS